MRRVRTRLAGALPAVLALTTATACGGGATPATAPAPETSRSSGDAVEPLAETPAPDLPAGAVDAGAASGLTKDFTALTSEALVKAAPDAILVMTKGLECVGGVDGLVEIPGVAQTPAGMDRRIVSVEDGVLHNYGPRTDQVLTSVMEQLYREDGAA